MAQEVLVEIVPEDRPGRPISRVTCERCGEGINDRREVVRDGQILCRACAHGAYYQPLSLAFPLFVQQDVLAGVRPDLEQI